MFPLYFGLLQRLRSVYNNNTIQLHYHDNLSILIAFNERRRFGGQVLSGSLEEIRYDWPAQEQQNESSMNEIGRGALQTNGVCYINGK